MDEHAQPRRRLGHFGDDVHLHVGVLDVGLDLLEDGGGDVILLVAAPGGEVFWKEF